MHDVHDMAYEDIAGALGIPVGTVKSRLHRGRVALAEELGEGERGRGHRRPGSNVEPDASADSLEHPAAPAPSKERFPE